VGGHRVIKIKHLNFIFYFLFLKFARATVAAEALKVSHVRANFAARDCLVTQNPRLQKQRR